MFCFHSPDGDRAVDALQARDSLKIYREAAAGLLASGELHNDAGLAQLVERYPSKVDVIGSRPIACSISGVPVPYHSRDIEGTMGWDVLKTWAQLQRSERTHNGYTPGARAMTQPKWIFALLAQLVERFPCKKDVVRSIRTVGSRNVVFV